MRSQLGDSAMTFSVSWRNPGASQLSPFLAALPRIFYWLSHASGLHRDFSGVFPDESFQPVTSLELSKLSFTASGQEPLYFSNFEAVSKRVYSSIYGIRMRVQFVAAAVLGLTNPSACFWLYALQPTAQVKTLKSTTGTRTSDSHRSRTYAVFIDRTGASVTRNF
jgi:hypothetical protein